MDVKSNFPNQYRATNVTILIRTPPQFVNAKLISDYPTHRLHTTKDNHLILEITNLFGSSSTSACISVALTDLNFPKSKFHSFEISFEIADFSFAQLKVEKFKLLRIGFEYFCICHPECPVLGHKLGLQPHLKDPTVMYSNNCVGCKIQIRKSLNRKSCSANRKIRTFCHSNKSFILNKVE